MASEDVNQTTAGNQRESTSGKEIFPFDMGFLPPRFQKKADEKLNESPENIEKGLKYLREKAKNDKYCADQSFDDHFLIQFLRYKEYDFEGAFGRFKRCITFRANYIDMFTNFEFETLSPITRNNMVTFLSRRCHEGCAILRAELENWNPEEFSITDVKRAVIVLIMQSIRDPMTQVNGCKVICNVKSSSLKQMRHCTPSNIYMIYHGTQQCAPVRYKEIHFVNESKIFDLGWMIAKPFLSRKVKQRIFFHPNPETLVNYFPRSVLPVEYGGENDQHDLDVTEWLRKAMHPDKMTNIAVTPSSVS